VAAPSAQASCQKLSSKSYVNIADARCGKIKRRPDGAALFCCALWPGFGKLETPPWLFHFRRRRRSWQRMPPPFKFTATNGFYA